jgi:hypothetical protein
MPRAEMIDPRFLKLRVARRNRAKFIPITPKSNVAPLICMPIVVFPTEGRKGSWPRRFLGYSPGAEESCSFYSLAALCSHGNYEASAADRGCR